MCWIGLRQINTNFKHVSDRQTDKPVLSRTPMMSMAYISPAVSRRF